MTERILDCIKVNLCPENEMSLIGNLEDLCLGEILQIVNLSRKTGILTVRSEGRKAVLCFHDGQVIQAMSTVFHRGVGELLIRRGILDEMSLLKAAETAKKDTKKPPIGTILIRDFGVSKMLIETVVREQIERVIFSLFSWVLGTFDFEPKQSMIITDDLHLDPVAFMVRHGMNPRIVLGVAENQQKMQYAPPVPKIEEEKPVNKTKVIVVDDDEVSRDTMCEALTTSGYDPDGFSGSEDALVSVDKLVRSGENPVLLVDLIMPRMDGSGILGGIEFIEIIRNSFNKVPILVVSDYHNADAEKKVVSFGCRFMIKPRKSEFVNAEVVDYFINRLVEEIRSIERKSLPEEKLQHINLGDELRREMGADSGITPLQPKPSVGLTLLRGMLEELNEPALGGGVILLLLRFASEFMNRAVIFMVDDDNIFALGQFGVLSSNVMTANFVRELVIPRKEKTLLSDVVVGEKPVKVKPDVEGWNHFLFEKLGGVPFESFVAPVMSEGKAVAVLYGDNFPDTSHIQDTDALEIFLSQAGMAMEKALLSKRLGEAKRR